MPASVIGPVSGPRSASTSRNDRVAGRRRAARDRGCEVICDDDDSAVRVGLRCGLAIGEAYRGNGLPAPTRVASLSRSSA